jgi:hypothetical protein
LAKSPHPDPKNSSSWTLLTSTHHVSPLGPFRSSPSEISICLMKLLSNLSGMH